VCALPAIAFSVWLTIALIAPDAPLGRPWMRSLGVIGAAILVAALGLAAVAGRAIILSLTRLAETAGDLARDLGAAGQARDLVAMPSAGDIVLYGTGAPGGDVSFIDELGAHAGPSEEELHTFILSPPRTRTPEPITHPIQLYEHFLGYQDMGGPDIAPHTPQTLVAPRQSRGAPRNRVS